MLDSLELGQLDFKVVPKHGLIQFQFDLVAQVRAAKHLGAAAATAPTTAENVAEYVAKNIAEGIRAALAGTARGSGIDTGVTMLVVNGALLRIAEHLGGLLAFLEFVLGLDDHPGCDPDGISSPDGDTLF